jgi:hypothetical protein
VMDENQTATAKAALQKFGLPTAAGVIGTGVGLILTRKPSSNRQSSNSKGVGNLVDDLRSKLESVIGKSDDGDDQQSTRQRGTQNLSAKQLADRRRQREQRRKQRRSRARR